MAKRRKSVYFFHPRTKASKCKHGKVKSGPRKGLCRLHKKRRR
jgi:hypothetical protein